MRITDGTILVTGGGSGIGRGLAEALHARGNRVIVAGRRDNVLAEVAAENPGITALTLDIADPASIAEVAARVIADHPSLDAVIHAAGVAHRDDAAAPLDDAMLAATFATNVYGPLRLTSALLPHLKQQPSATLVYVTSMLAHLPFAQTAVYSASKAALHSFVLAQRYALRSTTIEVVEIAPPLVATALAGEDLASRAMPLDAFVAETIAALEAGGEEALVDRARNRRDALRGDEIAAMAQFNGLMGA